MQIDAEFLQIHLDYTFWASRRALESVRGLPEHVGAFETLVHIFQADRIWLSRTTPSPLTSLAIPGETLTVDSVAGGWEDVANGWRGWVATLGDVRTRVHYRNLAGQPHSVQAWEMVMHVVNHGTYHRGQIATKLRQAGHQPVPTDFHVYRLGL